MKIGILIQEVDTVLFNYVLIGGRSIFKVDTKGRPPSGAPILILEGRNRIKWWGIFWA